MGDRRDGTSDPVLAGWIRRGQRSQQWVHPSPDAAEWTVQPPSAGGWFMVSAPVHAACRAAAGRLSWSHWMIVGANDVGAVLIEECDPPVPGLQGAGPGGEVRPPEPAEPARQLRAFLPPAARLSPPGRPPRRQAWVLPPPSPAHPWIVRPPANGAWYMLSPAVHQACIGAARDLEWAGWVVVAHDGGRVFIEECFPEESGYEVGTVEAVPVPTPCPQAPLAFTLRITAAHVPPAARDAWSEALQDAGLSYAEMEDAITHYNRVLAEAWERIQRTRDEYRAAIREVESARIGVVAALLDVRQQHGGYWLSADEHAAAAFVQLEQAWSSLPELAVPPIEWDDPKPVGDGVEARRMLAYDHHYQPAEAMNGRDVDRIRVRHLMPGAPGGEEREP